MATATRYRKEVQALIPGGGAGVELPEPIRQWWQDQEVNRQSPSSIVSFLECPAKWFVERHLEKANVATGETILGITDFTRQPPNMFSVGGTLSHRALEVFYAEPPELRTEDLLEEIYDFAAQSLARGDYSDGIVDKSLVADYNTMLDNLPERDKPISKFKKRFFRNYKDITLAILDMERPRSVRVVGNETFINARRGRMTIFGKIDREELNLKGEVKIVDYKTGRSPDGDISVFNKVFLPAGIYAYARVEETKNDFSARPIVGVQLMYLKDLRNCSIRATPQMLDDVEDILDMVGDQMDEIGSTGVVPTNPTDTDKEPPCRWCPIQKICPDWQ